MLACARIGATHSVVFGGFSADALTGRIQDADAKLVITADGGYRRGKPSALKPTVDEAVAKCPSIEHVLVVRRTGRTSPGRGARPVVARRRRPPARAHGPAVRRRAPAVHPLHLGHHRQAQGHPAHHRRLPDPGVLDPPRGLRPQARDRRLLVHGRHRLGHRAHLHRLRPALQRRHPGHVRGHAGHPHRGRFWEIDRAVQGHDPLHRAHRDPHVHEVGRRHPGQFDLSSLRLLGSVGEPINPEAWMWYREHIGGDRCPIVDTWWQTETGAIMISPLPGVTPPSRARRCRPLPGITADVVDDRRSRCPNGGGGFLVIREPWPSMLRTIWGDDQRFIDTYWSRFDAGTCTSPATAPSATRTATSGCSAGSTTSCSSPATTSPPPRWSRRWSPPEGGRGGRGRRHRPDHRAGDRRVRDPARRAEEDAGDGLEELRDHVAKTLGPIAKPRQIMLVPELPRPGPARSCGGCCATSPENRSWATSPRCRTRR